MPDGEKYNEPDELDLEHKIELLLKLNPLEFADRVAAYSKVIRLLQYFGYRRREGLSVEMIDEEHVIVFRKNNFSVRQLDNIPDVIKFAMYMVLVRGMNPDIPLTFEFKSDIMKILQQKSRKVKKRINKNFFSFMYKCGYVNNNDDLEHKYYPTIKDGEVNLNNLPVNIVMALWGYFVLPKLTGMQRRIGVINVKKKSDAQQRRIQKWQEQINKRKQEQLRQKEHIENTLKEIDDHLEQMKQSGF
mgnify:CR=1 FL=1